MAENQLPEAVVQKLDPNRRKFILGILAAGITAPTVASFVMGKANKSAIAGNPIRPASLIDSSGNFNFTYAYSGNSYPESSANYFYNHYSGNFLRDASGNFLLDLSGNLLCGTSGNIVLDMSGNAIPSGNFAYAPHPSGNWIYDPSSNSVRIPFRDPSGNATSYYGLNLDPSGNTFSDNSFTYDSNGVINYNPNQQNPSLACVVSANHIQQIQTPPSSTSSVAPSSTSSVAPSSTSAPTTSSAPTTTNPGVSQNGSGSSVTTTTVPVTPIVPNGSIPATK
jgi:hypothetical protein